MVKIFEKINKLSLPVGILIASIILGGFYYASQIIKQRSIEKQQQIKIEQGKQEQLVKELKEQKTKAETDRQARLDKSLLNTCLKEANDNFQREIDSYTVFLVETSKKIDISNPEKIFDDLKAELQQNKALCFKKYPQK